MSTIINATTTNGVVIQPDNSGSLQLATNSGTTALTIDTSQNVGIGTSSPNFRIQLNSPSVNTAQYVQMTNGSTGSTSADGMLVGVDSTNEAIVWMQESSALKFATASTERMRIDSSGNVGIGTTSPSTKLQVNGTITSVTSGSDICLAMSGANNAIRDTTNGSSAIYFDVSTGGTTNGSFVWRSSNAYTERMRIDSSGGLILAGSTAQKATGTTWSNPSDQRLKDNIRDYTKGTAELMQVRVREWEYNGKGGTTEGMNGLGVIADEVMTVLPNTVETYNAKLNADDEEDTEIKKFDATEITWLLVKTVQEQQTIINDLKARIETLEAK